MRPIHYLCLALLWPAPIAAQDLQSQEIIVTGSRIDRDDYSDMRPVVGLRTKADFLVQEVNISGDTRDPDERGREIRDMLRLAIREGDKVGIELATGDFILTRLTEDNADDIVLKQERRRPDSEFLTVLVKAPLKNKSVEQAESELKSFIEGVPEVGRAQMDASNDPTLSVVGPDSYHDRIVARVTQDAKQKAELFGDGYAVELTGLNMPVHWVAAGPGEVLLYIPYELRIVPE